MNIIDGCACGKKKKWINDSLDIISDKWITMDNLFAFRGDPYEDLIEVLIWISSTTIVKSR